MPKKHTHKYHRLKDFWACASPDCTHYLPKNVERMIEGRNSVCWKCDEVFALDERALKCKSDNRPGVIEPICPSCVQESTTGIKTKDIEKFLTELTGE